MRKLRKVVFPVAGLGTRMLPATKVLPKEMLPVVDQPIIQYALRGSRARPAPSSSSSSPAAARRIMEDHFDRAYELSRRWRGRTRPRSWTGSSVACRRPGEVSLHPPAGAKGLGHAVWCARHMVGDEPFAVMLVDDLILAEPPCLTQMVAAQRETGGNIAGA